MRARFLSRTKRRIVFGMLGLSGLWLVWTVSPGLPVWRGPRASVEVKTVGLKLFVHEWQPGDPLAHGDGLGPVFNARSCGSCHFQGGVGGGGGERNVLAFEVHPTMSHPIVKTGLVHGEAVEERYREKPGALRDLFPIVPFGTHVEAACLSENRDLDPIRTDTLNPTALFGAGWVDRISGKSITHQNLRWVVRAAAREASGDFHGVPPGRARVLADGRIGKFGWKAQFATLEEFVASACANEIGLGTPRVPQAKPLGGRDYPEVAPDLNEGEFRAMVAFVDTLPRPTEVVPADASHRRQAERGRALFGKIGCTECHAPDLGGVAGVYSDLLLHRVAAVEYKGYSETTQVPMPEGYPLPEEWKTPPLWGAADSAPYFHDGGSPTLESAIFRHHGDAEAVTQAYEKLPAADRVAVVDFLMTLRAPADATPAPANAKGRLAMGH